MYKYFYAWRLLCVIFSIFLAKNHGRLWRVNACAGCKPNLWLQQNSGYKTVFWWQIISFIQTRIELYPSNVTWACKFVLFLGDKEAFQVFVDIHAVQISSADSKISSYGFWICSVANVVPLHFTKKSVSIFDLFSGTVDVGGWRQLFLRPTDVVSISFQYVYTCATLAILCLVSLQTKFWVQKLFVCFFKLKITLKWTFLSFFFSTFPSTY